MANRAFIRFQNITIPNYSEVSNVFARLTAYSNRSDTPVNLRCAFVDEDNPDAPTSYAELQAFSLTDWVSWDLLEGWSDGSTYDSPDITELLQAIINRSGWSYGNNVILIIEDVSSSGQRGFSSIQFDSGLERAVLFANYLAREGGGNYSVAGVYESVQSYLFNPPASQKSLARGSNGHLYCVNSRSSSVIINKSIDGGNTWEGFLVIGTGNGNFVPSIALDSNDHIHVVWRDNNNGISYSKYTTSWSVVTQLSDYTPYQNYPVIAIDRNDYVHVTWEGRRNYTDKLQIRYRRFISSWGTIVNITTDGANDHHKPAIAIDGNDDVHIVWQRAGTSPGLFYANSSDWGDIDQIRGGIQVSPSIAIGSNNIVHVVWTGYIGVIEILQIQYAASSDWRNRKCGTDASEDQLMPSIALDSHNYVHVAWHDYVAWNHGGLIRYSRLGSGITTLLGSSDNDIYYPKLIWANYPKVLSIETNIPKDGFAFVHGDEGTGFGQSECFYYSSYDLAWNILE